MSGWETARAPTAFTLSTLGELADALVLCNRGSLLVPPLQTLSRHPAPMTSRGRQVILGLWRQALMTSSRRGAFPPPPPAWLVRFTWVGPALPPPPTCGGRSPAGGGVPI